MLPFKGHHPLRVFIPRKPHPNGFLIYLVCVRLDDGRTIGIEFRFDSDSSGTVDRRTPTEILASVSRTLREDFNLGDTPLVAHNDAAFGGPTGADICACNRISAIHSTARPTVHTLLKALSADLPRGCYYAFVEPRGEHELIYIVRKGYDAFEASQKVDGVNEIVVSHQERILVNTSAVLKAQHAVSATPQLTDAELRPFLALPRAVLFPLAQLTAQRLGLERDNPEYPQDNWTASRLCAYLGNRDHATVENILGAPALKSEIGRASCRERV